MKVVNSKIDTLGSKYIENYEFHQAINSDQELGKNLN